MTQLATKADLDGLFSAPTATASDLDSLFPFQGAPEVARLDPLDEIRPQAPRDAITETYAPPPIDMPGRAAQQPLMGPPAPLERGVFGEIGTGLLRGLITAGEGIAGAGEMARLDKLIGSPPFTGPFQKARESDALRMSDAAADLDAFEPGHWRWWASRGSEVVGTTLPMVVPGLGVAGAASKAGLGLKATTLLSYGTGMTIAGAIEGGLSYGEMRDLLIQRGYTVEESEDLARLGAVGYGFAAGITEVMPLSRYLKKVPGGRKVLMKAIMSGITEGGEEAIQEILERAAQVMTGADPDALEWDEEFRTALKVSGTLGGGVGVVIGGALPGGIEKPPAKGYPRQMVKGIAGLPVGPDMTKEEVEGLPPKEEPKVTLVEKPPEAPEEPAPEEPKTVLTEVKKVFGHDAVIDDTKDVGETRFELFKETQDGGGSTRTTDIDSGKLVAIKRHKTFDEAKAYYDDLVGKAGKAEAPTELPPVPEPPAAPEPDVAQPPVEAPAETTEPAETGIPISEATPDETPDAEPDTGPPSVRLAASVGLVLSSDSEGSPKGFIDKKELFKLADLAYGGTMAEGKWQAKDAYDAMELAVNRWILENWQASITPNNAKKAISELQKLGAALPTHTKRTIEQQNRQQFSTPPEYALLANWVANVQKGETYLEPSAGLGGLAVFGKLAGAKVYTNELTDHRAEMLESLGLGPNTRENAEHLNAILPTSLKPTVIVMNPPFSAAANIESKRIQTTGAQHVEQALARLEPGGRLVAIVGRGMKLNSSFTPWFKRMAAKRFILRANVSIPGDVYKKMGTHFGTRLLVFDKPVAGGGITLGARAVIEDAESLEQAIDLLQGVRDARVAPAEQAPAEPGRPEAPEAVGGVPDSGRPPVQPPTDVVAAGDTGAAPSTGGPDTGDAGVGPGGGTAGSVTEPSEPGVAATPEPEPGSGLAAGEPPSVPGEPGPVVPTEISEADLRKRQREREEAGTEGAMAVFQPYEAEVTYEGAKPHPTPLVETTAMSTIDAPPMDYVPNLPKRALQDGSFSNEQIEVVARIGTAHGKDLPDGQRRGMYVGDGTGTGKARIIIAAIWDNWRRGRTKAVWVTKNFALMDDAREEMGKVGWNSSLLVAHNKTKPAGEIDLDQGILVTTYTSIASKQKDPPQGQEPRRRVDQLIRWLGKDYDGIIAFDESHMMSKALPMKGKRGVVKASAMGRLGVELQRSLPRARIVYFSATPATSVSDLAYADRLGLWGSGSEFDTRGEFVTAIAAKGLSAMEIVSRELKGEGSYVARELSYEGVEYEPVVQELTPEQVQMYDELADGWAIVLSNIQEALKITNGSSKNVQSVFRGNQLRFFSAIIMGMKMPAVITRMKVALDAGMAPILQLVNTNDAQQERTFKAKKLDEQVEDLDFSPKEMLLKYVQRSFPVTKWEEYEDEEGNIHKRQVKDSKGNPLQDPEAVKLRQATLLSLASLRAPDSPLDQLINEFGPDAAAEVTGRKRRRILGKWTKTGEVEEQKHSATIAKVQVKQFKDDKRHILVFSGMGATGASYHADRGIKNQRRRIHFIIQAGYVATGMKQGEGRSHRANQSSAPIYAVATTNLKTELRFTSTITARMESMGAIGRGERKAGSGLFKPEDNLESKESKAGLHQLFEDIFDEKIEGMGIGQLEGDLQLLIVDSQTGGLSSNLPDMSQFLNRLLAVRVKRANEYFDALTDRISDKVEIAREAGTLDVGTENLVGTSIIKTDDQVVYVDPDSKSTVRYVTIKVTKPFDATTFSEAVDRNPEGGFVVNASTGVVYGKMREITKTDAATGYVHNGWRLLGPRGNRGFVPTRDLVNADKWTVIDTEAAGKTWKKNLKELPAFRDDTHRLLVGNALLKIWSKLPDDIPVKRAILDDGESLLGVALTEAHAKNVLKALGVSLKLPAWTESAASIMQNVVEGKTLKLDNEWRIEPRRVEGETRVEIAGPSKSDQPALTAAGVKMEIINLKVRYSIPLGQPEVLEKVLVRRKVLEVGEKKHFPGARRGMASLDFLTVPIRAAVTSGTWTVNSTVSAARWLWHLGVDTIQMARSMLTATFGGGIRPFIGRIWTKLMAIHAGEMKNLPSEVFLTESPAPESLIHKLYLALKRSQDIQADFEGVKTAIRKKQAGRIRSLKGKGEVRARIRKKVAAMAGKMPKGGVTPLDESLTEQEIDALLEHWEGHQVANDMSPQQHGALSAKLLDLMIEGSVPFPNDVRWFEIAFGPRFGHLLRKRSFGFWKKFGRAVTYTTGLTRTFKTMWDLSATLRQGFKLFVSHPYQAGAKPFVLEVGTLFPFYGEKLALNIDARLRASEQQRIRMSAGLQLPRLSGLGSLTDLEEDYQSRIFPNTPYLRHLPSLIGLRQSERAFITFLNLQRATVFDYHARKVMASKDSIVVKQQSLKKLARFVNAASGRGNLSFGDFTGFFNSVFFAPRYMVSQFEYIPRLAAISTRSGLKELAARQLVGHLSAYAALYFMAKALADHNDWDLEFDINPRSPRFLKLAIGNTTVDFSGGLSTGARILVNITTASSYDPNTDKTIKKDPIIATAFYFKNKLSPALGTALQVQAGKRYNRDDYLFGEPAEFAKQLALDLVVPITAETFVEAAQVHNAYGTASLMTGEVLGLGTQEYTPPTKAKPKAKGRKRTSRSTSRSTKRR